jgi:predicted transcriptional regulator of viral defense system
VARITLDVVWGQRPNAGLSFELLREWVGAYEKIGDVQRVQSGLYLSPQVTDSEIESMLSLETQVSDVVGRGCTQSRASGRVMVTVL